jgi:hypothetical protein
VNKLKKQAKVQPPQDNRNNIVKKREKGKITANIASQPPKKQVQNKKDEKVEYARRSHIKSKIGYKNGDKHNSRVNTKGQNSSSSSSLMSNKKRSKASRPLTMSLILMLMFLICHIMILMLLMYL